MSPSIAAEPLPHGPIGRFLTSVSAVLAIAGGLVLVFLMLVSSFSVIGRNLPDLFRLFGVKMTPQSIPGDTEIVQLCCGIAIFAFLPYCQITRGNVFVDFFTKSLPVRGRAFLDMLANLLFLALVTVIAVQHGRGMIEKFHNNDTTMVLRLPEGWAYVATLVPAVLLVIVTFYTVCRSIAEIIGGRAIGPQAAGAH